LLQGSQNVISNIPQTIVYSGTRQRPTCIGTPRKTGTIKTDNIE